MEPKLNKPGGPPVDLNVIVGNVLILMGDKQLTMPQAFEKVSEAFGLPKENEWYEDKKHYMHAAWSACMRARLPIVEYAEQQKTEQKLGEIRK